MAGITVANQYILDVYISGRRRPATQDWARRQDCVSERAGKIILDGINQHEISISASTALDPTHYIYR